MMYRANNTIISKGKTALSRTFLAAIVFAAGMGSVNAAPITGSMGLTGNFSANPDLGSATDITLNTVVGTSGTGDIGGTVGFGTGGSINNGLISLASFAPIVDLMNIGGWQLDLTSLSVVDQSTNLLTMQGNGTLSGNLFDATSASWTFSAQTASSYSMTVTASPIPVPAAVWLFGSGLLGLVGIAGRKRS